MEPLKPDRSRADVLGVRGTRAVVASVGASMALVLAGTIALAVVSALIGFRGLPGVAASFGMGQQELASASATVPGDDDAAPATADVPAPIVIGVAPVGGARRVASRAVARDRAATGARRGRDVAAQAVPAVLPTAVASSTSAPSEPIRLPAPVTTTTTKEPTRPPTEVEAQPSRPDTPTPATPTPTPVTSVPAPTPAPSAPAPVVAPVSTPLPVTVPGTPVSVVVSTQPIRDLGDGLDGTVSAVGETAAQAVGAVVPSLGPTVSATTGTVGDVLSGTTGLVSGLVDGLTGAPTPPPGG